MTTLEQEQTTVNVGSVEKDSQESFSATLKKAIDLSTSSNNNEAAEDELNNKRFYYSSGPNNFLIEKDLKAETLKNMTINHIPFTPVWFMGIVSIRGVIMPVINICEFLNTQTKTTKKAIDKMKQQQEEKNPEQGYLLKLEHNAHTPIVIQIDHLPTQLNISNVKKQKVAKTKPGWMLHKMRNGTSSIIEIDHHALLNQITEIS